jgi:hypothetical protein
MSIAPNLSVVRPLAAALRPAAAESEPWEGAHPPAPSIP